MNSAFCARRHVTSVQTSSPSNVMVTTSMETRTSPNEPMTVNFHNITKYTTGQEKVSNQVSVRDTELRIGKCLIDRNLYSLVIVSSVQSS